MELGSSKTRDGLCGRSVSWVDCCCWQSSERVGLPEKIAQGARLASLGYCAQCHTAPGGKLFAGGYLLKMPFGTIHGTNITPNPETGIGSWSEEAFARAMGEGVDREGHHLYTGSPTTVSLHHGG